MAISSEGSGSVKNAAAKQAAFSALFTGAALLAGTIYDTYQSSKQQKQEFEAQRAEAELSLSRARLAYLSGGIRISGTALYQEEYALDNLFTSQAMAKRALNYRTLNRVLSTSLIGASELYKEGLIGRSVKKT